MVIEDQHAILFSRHLPVPEICLTTNYIIFAFNIPSQYYQMKSAGRHADCDFSLGHSECSGVNPSPPQQPRCIASGGRSVRAVKYSDRVMNQSFNVMSIILFDTQSYGRSQQRAEVFPILGKAWNEGERASHRWRVKGPVKRLQILRRARRLLAERLHGDYI